MSDQYLHGHHESVLRSHTWRTAENSAAYLLPHLQPGAELLDIGCGPATVTIDLARLVAPGRVVGLEQTEEIIEIARANAADAGAPATLTFASGDAYELPFADGSFDVVHAHQVLQHLSDPVAALREMRRVCRPGGLVAVRESDYGAMTYFPDLQGIGEWKQAYRDTAYAGGYFPDAGRMLKSWALEVGFADVAASGSVWCYASDDEVAWWSDLWAERIVNSAFAGQAVERGVADEARLAELSEAWREWGRKPAAWFLVPHGELICRV